LILIATLVALLLCEDFALAEYQLKEFLPYLGATAIIAMVLVPATGLSRVVWLFGSLHIPVRVTGAVIALCLGAVTLCFFYNGLNGVPRSLPYLQGIASIFALGGVRALYSLRRMLRHQRTCLVCTQNLSGLSPFTILIVGVTRLTELYVQALAEMSPGQVSVAGLVAQTRDHTGRIFAGHQILGVSEDIESILNMLEVHGVTVDCIVVVIGIQDLSEKAQEVLVQAKQIRGISLQFLTGILKLEPKRGENSHTASEAACNLAPYPGCDLDLASIRSLSQRRFWKAKRALDVLAAIIMLLILAPLFLLEALLVAATVGFPVVFWQRRPGRGGRPFHLYKFRTMRAAYASDGRRLPDDERVPLAAGFLRRARLDELPQLLNILRGDMSFVGPRPLLPRDQPKGCSARLLVRPGLTGWAQVVGGRCISAEDKLALDLWYVRNASFFLDLAIAARTIPVLLFGESVSQPLIELAWQELMAVGTVK
jgi:lipopolysaccharide/colanic/teichoic acid biosynthesis glycosyltransferase